MRITESPAFQTLGFCYTSEVLYEQDRRQAKYRLSLRGLDSAVIARVGTPGSLPVMPSHFEALIVNPLILNGYCRPISIPYILAEGSYDKEEALDSGGHKSALSYFCCGGIRP
jgi:hypothetical protein